MALRLVVLVVLVVGASPVIGAPFIVGDTANTGIGTWDLINCTGGACVGATPGSPAATYPFTALGTSPLDGAWDGSGYTTSQWISSTASAYDAPAQYTYRLTFSLAGYIPSSASLLFRVMADDELLAAQLNGGTSLLSFGESGAFDTWHSSPVVTTGFLAGDNTLDFVVANNQHGNPNPTGLRVEIQRAEADLSEIPEPASMGLMGLGLVGLAAFGLRRRNRA